MFAAAIPQIETSHPMPCFLRSAHCATLPLLKTLIPPLRRPFTSASFPSAFTHNLLRILHNEITYLLDYRPPIPPLPNFNSFSIDPRPGRQSIRLITQHGKENIKVDVTMVDGAVPRRHRDDDLRLHISVVVEVSKGDAVLAFGCSAWQDCLEVQRVFPVVRGPVAVNPYMGRDFKKMDGEIQDAVYGYLDERGVDDELAGFLHEYVAGTC